LITVLFFSVSWQTIYYENANAISSLSPINLLLQECCICSVKCQNRGRIKSICWRKCWRSIKWEQSSNSCEGQVPVCDSEVPLSKGLCFMHINT